MTDNTPNSDFFDGVPDDDQSPQTVSDVDDMLDDMLAQPEPVEKAKNEDALPNIGMPTESKKSSRNPIILGCGLLVAAIALCCCLPVMVLGGGAVALTAISESNKVTETTEEVLPISDDGDVNLEVNNLVGSVNIQGRNVDEIQVDIKKEARAISESQARERLDDIQVDVRRDGNRYIIDVTGNNDSGLFDNLSVDLDITVPEDVNVVVNSDVGSIHLKDVRIVDNLDLSSDVGSIEFEGTISNPGTYQMYTSVGSIDVRVSNDSRFSVDARTNVGTIQNSLTLTDSDNTRDTVSSTLRGDYGGSNPQAILTLTSDVGSISLRD